MAGQEKFFQSINYASFHEDSNSERRALELTQSDRVLCLTGSGARPLDLLLDGPNEIIAVDWNPAQSHLLELKLAVIKHLSYGDGMSFLGLRTSTSRESMYAGMRPLLSSAAKSFWDSNPLSIRRGIYFDGRWERFLRQASWLARRARSGLAQQILDCSDLVTQQKLWRTQWDNAWWKWFLWCSTNRFVVRYLLREPGLQYVPTSLSISTTIRQRFGQASSSFLFRESPWIWALFKGRIDETGPLPEHLKPHNFEKLREHADCVTVVTASIQDYLKACESDFDAFSLSDFSSYCDQATHEKIWSAVVRHSRPNARFCERKFLVDYPLTADVKNAVRVDESLCEQLRKGDRSVVYTFLVARLRGDFDSKRFNQ
jgi:S-adenosylmethionine-diacylglycerol 3-amino-3-carboxypropyl transferase